VVEGAPFTIPARGGRSISGWGEVSARDGADPTDTLMSDASYNENAQLSRRQAAERLTDVAYALTAGGCLKLGADHDVSMPVGDQLVFKWRSRSRDGRVELGIELSWLE
jgi:amphi-Trp domain-containing protein